MKPVHRKLLIDLLSLPTSPLNEHQVIDWILGWARSRPGLKVRRDRYGNMRLRLRRGKPAGPPLMFAGHLDHPGFEVERMIGRGRLRARWHGGVLPAYFRGSGVRFDVDGRWRRGTIRSAKVVVERGRKRVDTVTVDVEGEVPAGAIGMWDLPDPAIRGTRLRARGCDDIAGVAAILAAMDELTKRRSAVDVSAMLTRGEEIGFTGALGACRSGLIPRAARIVAVECSSEIAGVRMGDGPILRVGDRSAIFTPELTAYCERVARDLAKRDRGFAFQRKLMDGGTCESTAYVARGYAATGVCLALGNYHNMDVKRKRIAAEYIDVNDFARMVKWFVALATTRRQADEADGDLAKALARLERRWLGRLEKTAAG